MDFVGTFTIGRPLELSRGLKGLLHMPNATVITYGSGIYLLGVSLSLFYLPEDVQNTKCGDIW